MSQSATDLLSRATADIAAAVGRIAEADIARLVDALAAASHVAVYGCGREGLQMRGLAMRLFHLGRSVSVVGDMTTPPVGRGDLFLVTAGPGFLSTALALAEVAKSAGAKVMAITAEPDGAVPKIADEVLVIPAQTMASDRGETVSALPMGSVYEGALFLLFEIAILRLKAKLGVTDQAMRANHTNLE